MTGDEDCTGHDTDDEECGFELASWLSNNDQSSLDGDQFIYTHTIGFNLTSDYLRKIAEEHGGGRYYEAQSASDLVNSFENIFSGVDSIETSFVAPGATVNQFNRLTHRNDIYFALFKPQSRPNWAGNLKKYEIGVNSNGSVIIYDHSSPRKNAINKEEGFFDTESKSDWSTVVDGRDVTLGGAAEQISRNYTADGSGSDRRQMYTYLGSSGSIPTAGLDIRADGDIIHESNTNFTDEHVGLVGGEETVSGVESNRRNLLRWIRGVDVKDEDSDGNSTTDMRAHIGDPMHSRPVIVNYENGIDNDPYTTIYFGTNEGTLHGINNVDGKELFSFMPKSLLENVAGKFKNSGHEPHTYGLDGPITTMISDPNGNVMVDSGESAKLFVGMRRGGSNYYAFDVSRIWGNRGHEWYRPNYATKASSEMSSFLQEDTMHPTISIIR